MPFSQPITSTSGEAAHPRSGTGKVKTSMRLTPRSEKDYTNVATWCFREQARLKKEKGHLSSDEHFNIYCLTGPFEVTFSSEDGDVPKVLSQDVQLSFPRMSLPWGPQKVIERAAALIREVSSRDEKVWDRFKQVKLEFDCYAQPMPVKRTNKGKGKAPGSGNEGVSKATWMIAVHSVRSSNLKEITGAK